KLMTASTHFRTLFFFFQAEDGIRDLIVTGVQTCALPIYVVDHDCRQVQLRRVTQTLERGGGVHRQIELRRELVRVFAGRGEDQRSEERRVGKECRYRWSP